MSGAVVCGGGAHTVHLFAGNLLEEALVLVTSVLSTAFRSTSALFGNRLFYRYHYGRTIRSIVLEPTLLVEPTVLPRPFYYNHAFYRPGTDRTGRTDRSTATILVEPSVLLVEPTVLPPPF